MHQLMLALVERWTKHTKKLKLKFPYKKNVLSYVDESLNEIFGYTGEDQEPLSQIDYFSIGGRWHLHFRQMSLNPLLLQAYYEEEIRVLNRKARLERLTQKQSAKIFNKYFPGKHYNDYFKIGNSLSYLKKNQDSLLPDIRVMNKRLWTYVFLPLRKDWDDISYPTIMLVDEFSKGFGSTDGDMRSYEKRLLNLRVGDVVGKYWGVIIDYHY